MVYVSIFFPVLENSFFFPKLMGNPVIPPFLTRLIPAVFFFKAFLRAPFRRNFPSSAQQKILFLAPRSFSQSFGLSEI